MRLETYDAGPSLANNGTLQIILGYRNENGSLHHWNRGELLITGFVIPSAWQPAACTK